MLTLLNKCIIMSISYIWYRMTMIINTHILTRQYNLYA